MGKTRTRTVSVLAVIDNDGSASGLCKPNTVRLEILVGRLDSNQEPDRYERETKGKAREKASKSNEPGDI